MTIVGELVISIFSDGNHFVLGVLIFSFLIMMRKMSLLTIIYFQLVLFKLFETAVWDDCYMGKF